MESYFLFSSGELRRKDNVVRMTALDGRFKVLKIEVMRDLYLFGKASMNTDCLNYLAQSKIPVHFFNHYGFYTGTFYPKEANVSGNLLIRQVEHYTDFEKRLNIAQEFIQGACYNILKNLKYYRQRGKELDKAINEIQALEKMISRTVTIEELMGIEGNIHRVYYGTWTTIINQEVDFEKRVKRPPDNVVNTLISFLNSLVYTTCLSEIYVSQLNPTISYLHSAGERRFSLSLDIAEIFKPLLTDRIIFSLLNRKVITEKDFSKDSNYFYLKDKGKRKVLEMYNSTLDETVRHKDLKRNVSYRKMMRLECYKLIKHLLGEREYQALRKWW
ncbi:type I-B CRISPR-associated endonuclease Cas1b [Vagococcus entomophilus]|uniref:CRISPR-associated endonuclease Cas1 n=1 Tax=Vagococcus entomophilus TaxID=1160095 RepID=A0A430AKM8_9ENTE|nr:type I-B CRISPR-associated endonuclease Cas1b [Vagococcus entomophilus]RSU08636.1 subtype I-B CRISPR-associated endonuclease Cas1 [Vagococcus entomophilus]